MISGGGDYFSNVYNIVKHGARSECLKSGDDVIMRWDANVSCG